MSLRVDPAPALVSNVTGAHFSSVEDSESKVPNGQQIRFETAARFWPSNTLGIVPMQVTE
jgi:hypothetical protein